MSYKIVKIGTFEKADNDEDGEICISGPTVMKRYLDDPEETKKVLKDTQMERFGYILRCWMYE